MDRNKQETINVESQKHCVLTLKLSRHINIKN